MKIIASVYFSAQLKPGDAYELPETDAKMLIAAGLAVAADESPALDVVPRRTRSYGRRDLQAIES